MKYTYKKAKLPWWYQILMYFKLLNDNQINIVWYLSCCNPKIHSATILDNIRAAVFLL